MVLYNRLAKHSIVNGILLCVLILTDYFLFKYFTKNTFDLMDFSTKRTCFFCVIAGLVLIDGILCLNSMLKNKQRVFYYSMILLHLVLWSYIGLRLIPFFMERFTAGFIPKQTVKFLLFIVILNLCVGVLLCLISIVYLLINKSSHIKNR